MSVVNFIKIYGWDLLIILISIFIPLLFGKIFYIFFYKKLKKIAKKTKTEIDDKILDVSKKPIYIALILGGLYFGLIYTKLFYQYKEIFTKIFGIAWIFLATYFTIKVLEIIIDSYKEKIGAGISLLIKRILSIVIGAVGLMIVLGIFNIEISPLVASLGIAGLAVALALQDTLANFFSGIYLTADQPIRPGDFIEITPEIKGEVVEIGWRSTRLRTPKNNLVIIPNKKLSESIIINYNLPNPIITTSVEVEVSYNSDPKKVEKVIYKTAKKVRDEMDECIKDYEPVVRFYEFGASGLKFKVLIRVKKRGDQFPVGHRLRKELFEAFKKENIEIPYTTYTVYLKNGIERNLDRKTEKDNW